MRDLAARKAAGLDRQLALNDANSDGGRQVAGLIEVASILSPALVKLTMTFSPTLKSESFMPLAPGRTSRCPR